MSDKDICKVPKFNDLLDLLSVFINEKDHYGRTFKDYVLEVYNSTRSSSDYLEVYSRQFLHIRSWTNSIMSGVLRHIDSFDKLGIILISERVLYLYYTLDKIINESNDLLIDSKRDSLMWSIRYLVGVMVDCAKFDDRSTLTNEHICWDRKFWNKDYLDEELVF